MGNTLAEPVAKPQLARARNTCASKAPQSPTASSGSRDHPTLALQRAVGNTAVNGIVYARRRVGPVSDPVEHEADEMASHVVSARAPRAMGSHRCACGGAIGPTGECDRCRQRRLTREAGGVRRATSMRAPSHTAPSVTPSIERALRSTGEPLDRGTRRDMESAFGRDFGGVRVHRDSAAGQSAASIDALAYTAGSDIVFAKGHYAPHTSAGKHLIAHELTHVVQQGADGPSRLPLADHGVIRRQPAAAHPDPAPAATTSEFAERVFAATTQRLQENHKRLDEWHQHISDKMSAMQLYADAAAAETLRYLNLAAQSRRQEFFEYWAAARNPARRTLNESVITGKIQGGCQYCHESQTVAAWEATHPEMLGGPSTAMQMTQLSNFIAASRANEPTGGALPPGSVAPTAATPGPTTAGDVATVAPPTSGRVVPIPQHKLCGDAPPAEAPPMVLGPQGSVAVAAAQQIRPILDPLGPQGYRVIPEGIFSAMYMSTPEQIKTRSLEAIRTRQGMYKNLERRIAERDVEYTEFCPIVSEQLPHATPAVRDEVIDEIESERRRQAIIEAILAIVGFMLIFLAPILAPTVLAAILVTTGGLKIYYGAKDMARGGLYESGRGAGIFSQQQEQSADALRAGGMMQIVGGVLDIVGAGFAGARIPGYLAHKQMMANFRAAASEPYVGPPRPTTPVQQADGSWVQWHPTLKNVAAIYRNGQVAYGVHMGKNGMATIGPFRTSWSPGAPSPGSPWSEWSAAAPGGVPSTSALALPQTGGGTPMLAPVAPTNPLMLGAGPLALTPLMFQPGPAAPLMLPPGPTPPLMLQPGPSPYGLLGPAPAVVPQGAAAPTQAPLSFWQRARQLGIEGEQARLFEVARSPKTMTELVPNQQLRTAVYDMIESGAMTLTDFGKIIGYHGVQQFYMRTPLGNRWIDHAYPEGSAMVLRESKNVSDFDVTAKIQQQLDVDKWILDHHPDAIVIWRISGNGRISSNAYDILDRLRNRYLGRFYFELQDSGGAAFPTLH